MIYKGLLWGFIGKPRKIARNTDNSVFSLKDRLQVWKYGFYSRN